MINIFKHFVIGITVYCFIGLLGIIAVCRMIEVFSLYKGDIQLILTAVLIAAIAIKGYWLIETYIKNKKKKEEKKMTLHDAQMIDPKVLEEYDNSQEKVRYYKGIKIVSDIHNTSFSLLSPEDDGFHDFNSLKQAKEYIDSICKENK